MRTVPTAQARSLADTVGALDEAARRCPPPSASPRAPDGTARRWRGRRAPGDTPARARTDGRTVAQGALGWNLARTPHTIPIPGFKTEAQVRDNLGALEKGPLPAAVMAEIAGILNKEIEHA